MSHGGDSTALSGSHLHPGQGARALERIGLFWSTNTFAQPTASFVGSGKHVASSALVRALLGYSEAHHVDVLVPRGQAEFASSHFYGTTIESGEGYDHGRHVVDVQELASRLDRLRYDVLHECTGIDFITSGYARSHYAGHVFPITGSQMGISYRQDILRCFVSLLTAPIHSCDAIVCSTDASRTAMEKRLSWIAERYSQAWDHPTPPLPRLDVIPWGVDTRLFSPRDRNLARREMELPHGRPIILCVGRFRIHDKMDWTPLLLAFERVSRQTHSRPLLVLVGSNPSDYGHLLLAQAEQLGLRDAVRVFFDAPAACLAHLYSAADVFVSISDSLTESFGLTIVEAMSCALPVVVSDWNGYKELVVHGETGFKVRTDWADCLDEVDELAPILPWEQEHLHAGQAVCVDVGELARYLTQLVENPVLREEMGRRARERAVALYDWSVVVPRWESLWCELRGIASSLKKEERDRLDYLRPRYFEQFAHYASRIIDDETPVHLTTRGRGFLAGRGPLFLHPLAQGFLNARYLHAALAALKPAGWIGTELPVGKVLDLLCRQESLTRERALMHVMWLAKYDLVAFGGV